MWRIGTNFHKGEESVANPHIYEKLVSNHHMWKIGIKAHMCEELVPNPHTCKKLVSNPRRCEELVLNCHICQWQNCEELESNTKCSRIWVRNTHVCYIWNLISCVFFTKWEMLNPSCLVLELIFRISFLLRHISKNLSRWKVFRNIPANIFKQFPHPRCCRFLCA